jgi:hypothetical protein
MPLDQVKTNNGRKGITPTKSTAIDWVDKDEGELKGVEGPPVEKRLLNSLSEVKGKLVAKLFNDDVEEISEVEIKDLIVTLSHVQPKYVVLDGIVTQRLIDAASKSGVKAVVGVNTASKLKTMNVKVLTGTPS